jgi:3-keto-5-aminohexanoate cleavage enzyme
MTTPTHPPHPLRPYPPLIVNAALTGAVGTREQVPHLPVTPVQIAQDAWLCHRLGAAIVHLHAREPDGSPGWRRELYRPIIAEIRERCPGLVVCVTTSGRTFPELERRADVLSLEGDERPDMASLTLGSLNFRDSASVNPPATIEALAARMREAGIQPELEIFDAGMAYLAHSLLDRDLLEPPLYANIVLGSHNSAPARQADLAHLVSALPAGTVWAAAGIGAFALPVTAAAIFAGGHVRTGLEDSPRLDHLDRRPVHNSDLVRRALELGAVAGRPAAATGYVRRALGLTPAGDERPFVRQAVPSLDRDGMLRVLESANMHRVPSEEMDDFDVGHWLVAEVDGEPAGVAGWRLITRDGRRVGKTTLLAVDPARRSLGIGRELQRVRMELMRRAGATSVITNADRPETVAWYQRRFGYRPVGTVPKLIEFGLPDVDHWTTLEARLDTESP